MDDFQRELNELKTFIADLKADRAATKEKEKREAWTKYVSLTVVILAVIAAIASQWSGKYGSRVLSNLNDSTYYQAQASDEWAYYQAKSIKENIYTVGRDQLAITAGQADLAKKYETQIATYKSEKAERSAKAEGLQKDRDAARKEAKTAGEKGGKMGLAITLYTVAIAMTSVCLVTKKKPLWFMAMAVAGLGIYEMIMAWLV